MNSRLAREALRREPDDQRLWVVFATTADCIGDNVGVCGVVAAFCWSLAIGVSLCDRGIRNDSRDAGSVVIDPRCASQPVADKRKSPWHRRMLHRLLWHR